MERLCFGFNMSSDCLLPKAAFLVLILLVIASGVVSVLVLVP